MLSKAEALPKAICVKRKREIKTYRQKEDLVIPKFLQSHPQNRLPKDNYEQKDKLIIREIFKWVLKSIWDGLYYVLLLYALPPSLQIWHKTTTRLVLIKFLPQSTIFIWMFKLILNFIGFALLHSIIGPENLHHSLKQSELGCTCFPWAWFTVWLFFL